MLFLYSCIYYYLGIFIYFSFFFSNSFYLLLLLGLPFIYLLWKLTNFKYYFILVFIFFFYLGFINSDLSYKLNHIPILPNPILHTYIYGTIYKIESSNDNTQKYLFLQDIVFGNGEYPNNYFKIKIVAKTRENLKIGDIISGVVSIFPPSSTLYPYGFNFEKNSHMKGISANGYLSGKIDIIDNFQIKQKRYGVQKIFTKIDKLKDYLKSQIIKYSINDTYPFIIAISLGDYAFLPKKTLNDLRTASLSHLISISGYHISLITTLLFFIIRYILLAVPRLTLYYDIKKLTSFIVIAFLIFYLLLIGNHAPAVRAIIMICCLLLGLIFNFKIFSLNSLFFAGFIILLFNPFLLFNASFLLSFIATLTIISFWQSHYIKKYYIISKDNRYLKLLFALLAFMAMSFLIQLSIIPILAFYFANIPTLGIITNTLVAPIFSFITMPFLVIFFLTPSIIGQYFLHISELSLTLIFNIASYFANFNFSAITINFFPYYLLYIFLFFYVIFTISKSKYKFGYLLLALLPISYYFISFQQPDILIDGNFSTIAFKKNDNKYAFSTPKNNFIKSVWFKDKNINFKDYIYQDETFWCKGTYCLFEQNHKLISFAENIINYQEDCSNVDLIILQAKKPFPCTSALVIDKEYIKKNGSLMIFTNGKNIKIKKELVYEKNS